METLKNLLKVLVYGFKSAFILWLSAFVLGLLTPMIFITKDHFAPLLCIFTGPIGFVIGGILGAIIEIIHQKNNRNYFTNIFR